jgi:hypothetical protein
MASVLFFEKCDKQKWEVGIECYCEDFYTKTKQYTWGGKVWVSAVMQQKCVVLCSQLLDISVV